MRRIRLTGRHAVGEHQFAIVDDDLFDRLSRYAWKAKPNAKANHVYAVRTQQIDGVTRDVRMHREVLGYGGPLDVDHINRNALDNRRENLRVVSRAVNTKNTGRRTLRGSCVHCGKAFEVVKPIGVREVFYCGEQCKDAARQARSRKRSLLARSKTCERCDSPYIAHKFVQRFCSERCRKAAKYERQKVSGHVPPSRESAAAQARRTAGHGSFDS